MTSDSERRTRDPGREAAEWYVELDANPHDPAREEAFAAWLERSAEHEASFERCEAAVAIARELAARGVLDELRGAEPGARASAAASRAAAREAGRASVSGAGAERAAGRSVRSVGSALRELLGRPAVAWSVAAAAIVWAAAVTVGRSPISAPDANDLRASAPVITPDGAPASEVGAEAPDETDVSLASFVNPVALLPNQVVVDVHSVAVLPFDGVLERDPALPDSEGAAAAERIARQLHEDVVRQLASIPGVYVVDGRSYVVHAGDELAPAEIASLLSVRGVVAADVALDGGTVRVSLSMTDAVNDGRRIDAVVERPLDELPAVRTAIVSNIADALASAAF